MKRSKKITIFIIVFFIVIALIIIGRYGVGLYFKKKFSKRPPPGVVVEVVVNKKFNQSLESYCTSLSSRTSSYKIKKNEFTVLDARSKNRFLGLEPEPRPGVKSGSIEGSKSMPLNEIVNTKDNTFLDTKKLRKIFNSSKIISNKIVMSCGSSVSAASLALAYSLINDDYIAKIYIGSWTEFVKK